MLWLLVVFRAGFFTLIAAASSVRRQAAAAVPAAVATMHSRPNVGFHFTAVCCRGTPAFSDARMSRSPAVVYITLSRVDEVAVQRTMYGTISYSSYTHVSNIQRYEARTRKDLLSETKNRLVQKKRLSATFLPKIITVLV